MEVERFLPDARKYLSIFAFTLIVSFFIHRWLRRRSYPPGPTGLPLIGYIPFLGKKPHITLRDLSKKYGDVMSFYMGPQLVICITDFHLAKELLNLPQTLTRPPKAFDFLTGEGGFSGKSGPEWQEQRRFTFQTIRNLGLGKGLWETMIREDAVDFAEEIKSWNGKPISIEGPLTFSQASNSISLLFGRHLDKKDDKEDIEVIRQSTRELMTHFSATSININLPWLAKVLELFNIGGYRKFLVLLRRFESIFKKEVEKRLKSKDAGTKDDFIGCYLIEMEKRRKDSSPHTFTMENLLGNLFLLFVGGNDSTMASVSWLILLMATHQDIQKKVHQEIDSLAGSDGVIYYDDKGKLPYTWATLMEMTRWVSISPVFPPRYAFEAFKFGGYTIPKGSYIISNIWAIMHDPRYFKDPMEFRPERFLTENGTKVAKVEGYGAFSFGKRNCPGEGIAMMTMFLYFVSIMQKFKVVLPPGKEADLDCPFAGALIPKQQELRFIER